MANLLRQKYHGGIELMYIITSRTILKTVKPLSLLGRLPLQ